MSKSIDILDAKLIEFKDSYGRLVSENEDLKTKIYENILHKDKLIGEIGELERSIALLKEKQNV